jgi:hypothetical protein
VKFSIKLEKLVAKFTVEKRFYPQILCQKKLQIVDRKKITEQWAQVQKLVQ